MAINRTILASALLLTLLVAGCSTASPTDPAPVPAADAARSAQPSGSAAEVPRHPGTRPPGHSATTPPGHRATPPGHGVTPPGHGVTPPGHGATPLPGASRAGTRPPVVGHGPRTGRQVALTFDADLTDAMAYALRSGRVRSYANLAVIELLERRQVPATFFITGQWSEQYPALTRRLGHNPRFELANHSYEHAAFTDDCYGLPRVPANLMADDVAKTFKVLTRYGGRQTRYFRFPGLCHDAAAVGALAPLGLTVVDGDVVSGDPFATAAAPIVHAVLSQVQPGSIVIMHVTEANAQYTDEALPLILDGLRERGLEPVTLSRLLADA